MVFKIILKHVANGTTRLFKLLKYKRGRWCQAEEKKEEEAEEK